MGEAVGREGGEREREKGNFFLNEVVNEFFASGDIFQRLKKIWQKLACQGL